MANEENDVFRVVAQFRDDDSGTRFQNVYYLSLFAAADLTDAVIVVDMEEFLDQIYAHVAGQMGQNVEGELKRITNCTKRERLGVSDFTFTGTNAVSQLLPPQCAAQVLLPLKQVGRTGRVYLGGFCEDQQEDGQWNAGCITALENFADDFLANFIATSTNVWQVGVAQFAAGGALTNFTPFTGLTRRVSTTVRTQRRRTRGEGLT